MDSSFPFVQFPLASLPTRNDNLIDTPLYLSIREMRVTPFLRSDSLFRFLQFLIKHASTYYSSTRTSTKFNVLC